MSSGQPHLGIEEPLRLPSGEEPWIRSDKVPLRDEQGQFTRLLVMSIDITDRRRAELALRESQEDLSRAQAIGRLGSWRLDLISKVLTWSPEAYRLFGVSEGTPLDYQMFLGAVHPDDRERVDRSWQEAARTALPYAMDHRIVVNGEVKWVRARVEPEVDASGRLVGGFGTVQDITEARQQETRLRESELHLRQAQAIGGVGSFVYDIVGDHWTSSEELDRLFGIGPDYERTAAGWLRLVHPDEQAAMAAALRETLEKGSAFDREYRILRPRDGCLRWLHGLGDMALDRAGRPVSLVGTNQDITERKSAETALVEADRHKDEFLAVLAHELRNPLAPLSNGVRLLQVSWDKPERTSRTLGMMERQLQLMGRLIEDLQDVSRIRSGKITLRKVPLDLAAAVRQAVENTRPLMSQCGHDLRLSLPEEPLLVEADLTRLTQCFTNLLNNAAKYTPAGGRIALSLEHGESEACIRVRDNGMGIPAAMLSRVFELFTQVDRSQENSRGGLGIGLALVRRLLELHGGSVEAHSEGPGLGSEFVVRLPLLVHPKAPAARPAAAIPGLEAAPRHRVLVVDDNADAALSLSMLLETLGHDVRTAGDGVEAVDAAVAFRPQLILMDIGMPRMNGYEACAYIRAQSWSRTMIIVAVTGWGKNHDRQRSREAGFDHHVVKPLDPEQLERILLELPGRGTDRG